MKCYYVYPQNEDFGGLVHAETPGKAKVAARRGTDWFDEYDFETLRAKRIPDLDGKPINLENAKTVLSWSCDVCPRGDAPFCGGDCDQACPFTTDEEFWCENRCRCEICEEYRKGGEK